MEEKIIQILKELHKEIEKLEKQGYTVDITLPHSAIMSLDGKKQSTVRIYKPISVS